VRGDAVMLLQLLQLLLPNSLPVIADSLSEGPMLIMKGRERAGDKTRQDRGYITLQASAPLPVREFR
jgi:hypothetical protein